MTVRNVQDFDDQRHYVRLTLNPGELFAINGTIPLPLQLQVTLRPVGNGNDYSFCAEEQEVVFDASCASPLLVGDRFGSIEIVGFYKGQSEVLSCPSTQQLLSRRRVHRNDADDDIKAHVSYQHNWHKCALPRTLQPSCNACDLSGNVISKLWLRYHYDSQNKYARHVIGKVVVVSDIFVDDDACCCCCCC